MNVTVLYFAGLREALGCSQERVEVPAGVLTLGDLQRHLASRGEPWPALLETRNLRMARNQTMAAADAALADGDELAFFPPVTGG